MQKCGKCLHQQKSATIYPCPTYHTSKFQKIIDCKFAWFLGDNILKRNNEDSNAVVVRHVEDLEKLLK